VKKKNLHVRVNIYIFKKGRLLTNDDSKTTYGTVKEEDSSEEFFIDRKSQNSEAYNSNRSSVTVNSKAIEKLKYLKLLNTASSFWKNKFCINKKTNK